MKISLKRNEFGDTPRDHLSASHKGTAVAQLTDDQSRYKIDIKNRPFESGASIEHDYIILNVTFSKEIGGRAKELLSDQDVEFAAQYCLQAIDGELTLFVPYIKLNTFYAALAKLDPSITTDEMSQLRTFFHPDNINNRLGKQQRFFDDPAQAREKIVAAFNQKKDTTDAGMANLITDLLEQPVSAKINSLLKKALNGIYSDFNSPLDTPKMSLVEDLKDAKADPALIQNVYDGRYDDDQPQLTNPDRATAKH